MSKNQNQQQKQNVKKDQIQTDLDSAKPFKPAMSRRQNKQSDYIFKRYKYQENKIFKQKQNVQSENYGFSKKQQQQEVMAGLELYQNGNGDEESDFMPTDLFTPIDMINFQDFEEQDIQKQFSQQSEHKNKINENSIIKQQTKTEFSDAYDCKNAPRCSQQQTKQQYNSEVDYKLVKKDSRNAGILEAGNQGGSMQSASIMSFKSQDSYVRLKVPDKKSRNKDIKLSQVKNYAKQLEYEQMQQLESDLQNNFKKKKVTTNQFQATKQDQQNNGQIKGLKIQTDPDLSTVKIQITDKLKLACSPLPPGITLKCTIRRSKSLLNMINPQFDMYITNGFKHVISAKKYSMKNRELFKFSLQIGKYQVEECIARINANLLHNQYWIVGKDQDIGYGQNYSNLFGAIVYEKIKKGQKNRDFKVIIPPVAKNLSLIIDSKATQIDIDWLMKQIQLLLCNLQVNNQKEDKNVSQKNFTLYDGQDLQYHFLTLFKQSDNLYQMEINHPLSPLQAMAVALTRFDAQLK